MGFVKYAGVRAARGPRGPEGWSCRVMPRHTEGSRRYIVFIGIRTLFDVALDLLVLTFCIIDRVLTFCINLTRA